METIVCNVRDLDPDDRSALERVVGHGLGESHQLIVNVVNIDPANQASVSTQETGEIPDWWKIYEGLSETEIDALDQAIRQRADLTRDFA